MQRNLICFLLLFILARTTEAQNWTGNLNSDWNNPGNWDSWPLNGDDLTIDPALYTGAEASPVIGSNSVFSPDRMELLNGAELTINASLSANGRITLLGAGTEIILNNGTIQASGSGSQGRFIVSDGARVTMNGGNLEIAQRLVVELGSDFILNNGILSCGEDLAIGDGNATNSSRFILNNGTVDLGTELAFENEAGNFDPAFIMNNGQLNAPGGFLVLGVAPGAGRPKFSMNGGVVNAGGTINNDAGSTVNFSMRLAGNSVFNFNGTNMLFPFTGDSLVLGDQAQLRFSGTNTIESNGLLHATIGTLARINGNTILSGSGSVQIGNLEVANAASLNYTSPAALCISGNWINNGTFNSGLNSVKLNGDVQQNISGITPIEIHELMVENSSTGIILANSISISSGLMLNNGKVKTTDQYLITIKDNGSSNEGSVLSFIDGPMIKEGDEAFVFPIGAGNLWRRIAITAPSSASAIYKAEYRREAFQGGTFSLLPLNAASNLEHWTLIHDPLLPEVSVSLYWEDASQSGIGNCTEILLAAWNGTAWEGIPSIVTGSCAANAAGSLSGMDSHRQVFTIGFTGNYFTQNIRLCEGGSVIVGSSTYDSSGVYIDVLSSVTGGDSTVITDLSFEPFIDTSIALNGNMLVAQAGYEFYQWINCDSNETIVGETSHSFSPSVSGMYAVILGSGECRDTSTCHFMEPTPNALEENTSDELNVYPVPASEMIYVKSNEAISRMVIRDILGASAKVMPVHGTEHSISLAGIISGIYILDLYNEAGVRLASRRIAVMK